jgi:hypothetical protein
VYLDEEKLTILELRAIAQVVGMSTATKLTKRVELARAISNYIEKRKEN